MYAVGKVSPQRDPSQRFLRQLVGGISRTQASTNAEVLQEILHRYRSIGQPEIGFRLFDGLIDMGVPVLGVGEEALRHARVLLEEWPRLSTRDAVHLGVMRHHKITQIMSYDRGFDIVPWAERIEPAR